MRYENQVSELISEYVKKYDIVNAYTNDVYEDFCTNYISIGKRKFGRELSKLGYKSVNVRIDGKIERIIKEK